MVCNCNECACTCCVTIDDLADRIATLEKVVEAARKLDDHEMDNDGICPRRCAGCRSGRMLREAVAALDGAKEGA